MLGQTNIVSMFQTCHFKASCMLRVKSGKSELVSLLLQDWY